MQPKELITIGVVAVGGVGVLIFVASQKTTTTSTSVDPNAAATQNNIIAANTAAANTQAQESVALAQLATSYETTFDDNQTKVLLNAQNTSAATTQYGLAANATYQAALLDTAAKIESTLSGAQTAQYASYVTGQAALAGDAATTTQVGLQTAASQAIAGIQGNTATTIAGIQGTTTTNVASIAGATQQNVAQIQGNTATTLSANQTTAQVNAANQAASASKSNGFWGALSGIATGVASIFSGFNGAGGSGQIDSSSISAPATGSTSIPIGTPTFTNFGLPSLNLPQMSGNPAVTA